MTIKYFVLALGILTLAGCAAQRTDVPVTHPANPAAPEAPAPTESMALKVESSDRAHPDNEASIAEQAHHQHGQPAVVAPYQCPMHPDVRSDKPGRCPKCGMQLKKGNG